MIGERLHMNGISSQDGEKMAYRTDDNNIVIRNLHSCIWYPLFIILKGHIGKVNDICFSPDIKLVVSCSEDHIIIIWDITCDDSVKENRISAKIVNKISDHKESVLRVHFSPDGK